MSRARHRAKGGAVAYAGGDSNVMKEAKERKKGGGVMGEGDKPKSRSDRKGRATGGAVAAASAPGRKRGGGVGANLKPLSTAANTSKIKGEEAGTEGGGHKGENVSNP
jgi:hypothetical protein